MNDQIEGQMTIFDFAEYLPTTDNDDLDRLTFEEIKNRIEAATGLHFELGKLMTDDRYYQAIPKKGVKVSIDLSEFNCGGPGFSAGQKFVGVGIDGKIDGSYGGMGSPCKSIREAVECIKRNLPRYMEGGK